MFRASTKDKLNTIFERALEKYKENNYSRCMLIQFIGKKKC